METLIKIHELFYIIMTYFDPEKETVVISTDLPASI